MSALGLSDAGMWALTVVIVAGVVAAFCGVAYVVSLLQSAQVRAVEESAKMLTARLVQVEAARAQMVILCNEARDHLAVLQSFRDGYESFRSDMTVDAASAIRAQRPAAGGAHALTESLPSVKENGR